MGGVAPHTTPVRARPPSLGAICAASWRVGAGSLVLRGSCGSRRLGRGGGSRSGSSLGQGGGGDHPPCLRGWGPGPPRLAGRWGGWGGGSRRGLPAPPLGGGRRFPILAPLVSSAHSHPACACGRGRGAAPGVGGGEGRPADRSPGGPCRPEPTLCPPFVGCGHGRVMWGAASILFWCAAVRRPQAWCARCSGTLGWFPLRPRPPREQAAGGAEARNVQVQPHPPPPASRSLLGGGRPLGSGGGGGPLLWLPGLGGGSGGGGVGGVPPRPPAPSGVGLPLTRSRGGPATGRCGTRASEQAGKALRSQGHQCAHVM